MRTAQYSLKNKEKRALVSSATQTFLTIRVTQQLWMTAFQPRDERF